MNNIKKKLSIVYSLSLMIIIALFIVYILPISSTSAKEKQDKSISIELEDHMQGASLTGICREIYNTLLVKGATMSEEVIYVPLEKYNLKYSDWSSIAPLVCPAVFSLQNDFPYYEWLFIGGSSDDFTTWAPSLQSSQDSKEWEVTGLNIYPRIEPLYETDSAYIDNTARINDKLNELIAAMPSTANTRYKRLEYIHDYLCETITYNEEALNHKATDVNSYRQWNYVFSPHGAILRQSSVCEGYAKAFKLACDKLNIPCQIVSGNAGGGHDWNYVQMEDKNWYLVDVTFDDPIYVGYSPSIEDIEYNRDRYFLIGSDAMNYGLKAHIPYEQSDKRPFSYKAISKTNYDPSKQVEEPLVVNDGYLQDKYIEEVAASLISENETDEGESDTSYIDELEPTVNYTKKTIYVNKKLNIKVSNLSEDAVVTYKSSNPKIVKVTKSGKVTGLRKGSATITTKVKQNEDTYVFKTKINVKKKK